MGANPPSRHYEIAIAEEAGPPLSPPQLARLRAALAKVFEEAGVQRVHLSVALVDDATIRRLNCEFLGHDYPTDVISFPLSDEQAPLLEGEIVASVDTARATAERLGWPAADELLLYVVHGALHLVGYDDRDAASLAEMRSAERRFLANFGLTPPAGD